MDEANLAEARTSLKFRGVKVIPAGFRIRIKKDRPDPGVPEGLGKENKLITIPVPHDNFHIYSIFITN